MRATVTTAFPGAEDGTLHPRWIAVGEIITGSLAEAAVAAGWATDLDAAPDPQEIAPESAGAETKPAMARVRRR